MSSDSDRLFESSACQRPQKRLSPPGSLLAQRALCWSHHSLGHAVLTILPTWHVENIGSRSPSRLILRANGSAGIQIPSTCPQGPCLSHHLVLGDLGT